MSLHRYSVPLSIALGIAGICAVAHGNPTSASVAYTESRSPCADRYPNRWAYFGDFHVHTSQSFDAYLLENRNGPDAAYRYARGETIFIPNADGGTQPATIDRPLDFAAVTDHAEYLGRGQTCAPRRARSPTTRETCVRLLSPGRRRCALPKLWSAADERRSPAPFAQH